MAQMAVRSYLGLHEEGIGAAGGRLGDVDPCSSADSSLHADINIAANPLTVAMPPLEILYEDNHLLVINKPAGLATMGRPAGTATLLERAKRLHQASLCKAGQRLSGRDEPVGSRRSPAWFSSHGPRGGARMTEHFVFCRGEALLGDRRWGD